MLWLHSLLFLFEKRTEWGAAAHQPEEEEEEKKKKIDKISPIDYRLTISFHPSAGGSIDIGPIAALSPAPPPPGDDADDDDITDAQKIT